MLAGILSIVSALIKSMLITILAMPIDLHFNLDTFSHGLILAQQFQNVDLMSNIQTGWTDFLHSGKAGVLAIGVVTGYMIRGITS
jgi:hypothetical protein